MKRIRAINAVLCTLCVLCSLSVLPVHAAGDRQDPRKVPGIESAPAKPFVSDARGRISNRKAASLVKERYRSARILGITLMEQQGPPIYRVRTLSPDGVVKSVFVDGESGEVFE